MATITENSLRFVPSRVDGLPSVDEVVVFPDRLEVRAASKWVVVRFADIARWSRVGFVWRRLAHLGIVRGWPCVADRDWFHPPSGRFFRFYTDPAIAVFMPDEPSDLAYGQTIFRRIQDLIGAGGYSTFDLG
jgi:hypothetical protein